MKSFDVIVVGAGAAGCVMAARLAESQSRAVLLLEAGPDRRTEMPPALHDGWTIERETYFVKLERDVDFGDKPWHGDEGPMPSSRSSTTSSRMSGAPAWTRSRRPGFLSWRITTSPERSVPAGCR